MKRRPTCEALEALGIVTVREPVRESDIGAAYHGEIVTDPAELEEVDGFEFQANEAKVWLDERRRAEEIARWVCFRASSWVWFNWGVRSRGT